MEHFYDGWMHFIGHIFATLQPVHYQNKIQLKEHIKSYSAPLSDLLRSA